MNQPPDDFTQLRLAVQNLACAPQAQRRYVQLGMMRRAVGNLQRLGGDLQPLIDTGQLDAEQAQLIDQLRDALVSEMDADPEFLAESASAPREFLFSDALETDSWERLRQLARRCHSRIVGEQSAFIAILAK